MAERNNAVCSICGRPYHLCLSCKDSMNLHPWKIHCCSSDCYKTFQIVKGFNSGVYTKEEAKSKFKNVNLNNLENFIPHIKKIVKDILKEEKLIVEKIEKSVPSKKKNSKINEVVVDEEINSEIVECE